VKKWDIKSRLPEFTQNLELEVQATRVYPELGAGGEGYQSLPRTWSWRFSLPEFTQKLELEVQATRVYPASG